MLNYLKIIYFQKLIEQRVNVFFYLNFGHNIIKTVAEY